MRAPPSTGITELDPAIDPPSDRQDAALDCPGATAHSEPPVAPGRTSCEERAEDYHHVRELSHQILWTADAEGRVLDFSTRWFEVTGQTLEDSLGTGWIAVLHPEDRPAARAEYRRGRATRSVCRIDYRLRTRDGNYRWFHTHAAPRLGPDGEVLRWYGTTEDIEDRKRAEDALKASEALARDLLECTMEMVVVMDRDWRITFMNERGADYVQRTCGGRIGNNLWDLYPYARGTAYEKRYREALATGQPVRFEHYVAHSDMWLDLNACPTSVGLAVFFRDITAVKRANEALTELAQRDELTGLANRSLFNEALETAFAQRAERDVSVLVIDLDLFKEVNDTLGHPVGDKLLRAVALRFQSSVRKGDILARLGGDEFAVIHRNVPGERSVDTLAERLMAGFAECFFVDGIAIKLGASIGTADSSIDHTSANDLFKAADIALYRAKEAGRGNICAFDAGMAERLESRQSMKIDLEVALVLDELRLVYQPLVDLGSGRIAGAEALLRWRHPTKGEVSPGEFIPLAEDTGLVVEIGDWVLRQACIQAASWPDDRTVAVNLSPVQIRDETLPERVRTALTHAGIAPGRLELEITESVLLHDSDRNVAVLHALREMGVRIALDDFGTGFSSLSYLRSFPFDKLKLDRCFVGDIGQSPQSEAIIRAAGEMGRAMMMTTTAEGVETIDQLEWLRANGWSQAQGWYTGRPMEAAAMRAFMTSADAPARTDEAA